MRVLSTFKRKLPLRPRPDLRSAVSTLSFHGWSLYGAPWLQPVAISGKSTERGSAENKPKPLPWAATSCLRRSMVRRGSTVRVRQRAPTKAPQTRGFHFLARLHLAQRDQVWNTSQLLVYHFMFGPNYEAGCPTCSSMADGIDGLLPHLHARDVTFAFVSQAPLEKLQAYKRRMGWSFPWVSTARTDFNLDLGFSSSEGPTREWVEPMAKQLPPIAAHNASATGTDLVGYLTELFGFSSFVRDDGAVYHTYSTTGRGVEFLMGYYPILDHAPKGRDEGEAWQVWIRRHDEYESE
jgi:predicted dithiol-disulfide oxidoreductase (DUF899 family)